MPLRALGQGEVRIKVGAAGICESDLHAYRRRDAILEVRGHEASGTVVEIGSGARRVRPGDRVFVHPHHGCGACYLCVSGVMERCAVGHRALGVHLPGAFADYLIVDERNCIPLPPMATFVDGACMACTGATAYATLRRIGGVAHESLAIFGLDPLGLSCTLLAKMLGLRVIGIDNGEQRRELARRCGAIAALDAADNDVVGEIRRFCGVPGMERTNGVDYVITTSASTFDLDVVLASLRRHGRAAAFLGNTPDIVTNPSDVLAHATTFIRQGPIPLAWLWDLARLCAASGLSFASIVTHTFPLMEAPRAMRTADGGALGKMMLVGTEDPDLAVRASPL